MTVREMRRTLGENEKSAAELKAAIIELAKAAIFLEPLIAVKCPEALPMAAMAAKAGWDILGENGVTHVVSEDGDSFACVPCRLVSFSKGDALHRYCAGCHRFYGESLN